jgi:predicted metal-dependent peptidase
VLQIPTDREDRQWLERLLCYMMAQEDFDFCYVFHNINIVATRQVFAMSNGLPVPAAVTLNRETLQLSLLVYMPIITRIPLLARIELLKHEARHLIEGHFSTYGLRLIDTYGNAVAAAAMDCYVNQKGDEAVLEAAGLPGITVEKLGLKKGLSSEEYCELLKDKFPPDMLQTAPGQGDQGGQGGDPQAGTVGDGDKGSPFTGKGKLRHSEVFDVDNETAEMIDQYVRDLNRSLVEQFGDQFLKGRGWHGSDYDSFIKASQRKSSVPWHYFLRAKETSNRAEIVVPTRRRLSRRSPFHFGRVRQYGLDVVFMVDTSGSMGKEQLRLVDPELRGMHARGAHITVVHCDAAVARVEPYNPYQPLERFYGRGGTDFSPGLLQVRELYPRPGLFVCYTDGYGGIEAYTAQVIQEHGQRWYTDFLSGDPEISPDGIDSLWLIPQGCMDIKAFRENVVPWGMTVEIPAEDDRKEQT